MLMMSMQQYLTERLNQITFRFSSSDVAMSDQRVHRLQRVCFYALLLTVSCAFDLILVWWATSIRREGVGGDVHSWVVLKKDGARGWWSGCEGGRGGSGLRCGTETTYPCLGVGEDDGGSRRCAKPSSEAISSE